MSDEPGDDDGALQPRLICVLEQSRRYASFAWTLERAMRRECDLDVRVIRVGPEAPRWRQRVPALRTGSFRASVASRAGLSRRLAQREAEAIYVHSQLASLLVVGLMRRVPTVISVEATPRNFDDVAAGYGHRRQGRLLEWMKWRANRRAFEAASALVTWSHWAADSLVHEYGVPREKVTVIRPGVDLSRFRPAERPRRGSGSVRILFVGDDFTREGGEDLLSAMPGLGRQAELDVVTSSRVAVPEGVAVRVHTGVDARSDVLVDLFQRADVFVLPTRSETYAQVIVDALACGLPVVATRMGAIPEVVRPGVHGLLVTPGSIDELGAALWTMVNDGRLRRRMGESGLRLARREHDAQRNNRAILALLRGLARPRSVTGSVATRGNSVVQVAP